MTRSMPHPLRSFPQCLQVRMGWGSRRRTQDVSTPPFKGKNVLKSQHVFFCFFFWVKVGWILSQPIPATGNDSQSDVNIGDVNPPKGKREPQRYFCTATKNVSNHLAILLLTFFLGWRGFTCTLFFKRWMAWNGLKCVRFSLWIWTLPLPNHHFLFPFAAFWNWRPFR